MEPTAVAVAYYDALDEHDYDRLETLLDPAFVQRRPDLVLDGRDRFVQFMRTERPDDDTEHVLERTFVADVGEVAVEGTLVDADGREITSFVDVFSIEDDVVRELRTYTR